ncbi:amyloid-beta A4 precursor protein-binding family B member 3 isoform X3 [Mirounga angustirostris]|uniref:amyloid-beta A4 precursor protein-binding family B member 3 isoform X3 n=1 Tax=Mirounga angustirostris TaxID=9716 RepID=UPI00313B765C
MSSELRRDVSGGVGVGRCAFPGATHGNVHPLGDLEACLHAPPLGGRRCSGSSFPAPGTRLLPHLVFVQRPLAWPEQRGWVCEGSRSGVRAGLRLRAGEGRRGRGRAMLGKDYMLAIILVNCDDDLWGDQSLEGEPGLPPGWRKIRDAAGTYYWHVPSGSTQWQRPTWETGDAEDPGTGQNMLMILKKDAMSLVNPLDHSLIHCQPLVHIRVWGVGSSKGRDFAFVAGDKDSCMLKCHVFRCDVPAKAIASVLHGLCAQILSERVGVSGDSPCSSLDPISPEDLPRQVELLDAVSQAAQKYEALYMGTLPVNKAMGMDVLNEAIGILTTRGDQDTWVPAMLSVSDSLMTAHPIQAEAGAEEEPLWQCPVRLVTFIGVGRDPHTFGLIADLGRQSFQCAAFWCQPHAGGLSEAVQAACMVQYQKCLVASAARGKAWGAQARARLRLKRTSSVDFPGGPLPLPLLKGGVGGAGAAPRKRGVFSFLDTFRLKPSLLHMP